MGNGITLILPLIVLAGLMFFMTRSQKKQQQQHQDLLNNVKVGDKVVTIGRLHGIVSEIDEANKTVFIDCEGIILEFDREAIRTVRPNTTGGTTEPVESSEESTPVILEKEETMAESQPEEIIVETEAEDNTKEETKE